MVVVSDRQKGLLKAVKESLPNAQQRFCIVHLIRNISTNKVLNMTLETKELINFCSKSTNIYDLLKNMGMLFIIDEDIFTYLSKIDPNLSTNINSSRPTYNYVSSSSAESYNATIKDKKQLPFPVFLKCLINHSRVKFLENKAYYNSLDSEYLESTEKHLKNLKSDDVVVKSDDSNCSIVCDHGLELRVLINTKYCDCGQWSNKKLPCKHLKAVLTNRNESIYGYIEEMYKISFMKELYNSITFPYIIDRRILQTNINPPSYFRKSLKRNRIKSIDEIHKRITTD